MCFSMVPYNASGHMAFHGIGGNYRNWVRQTANEQKTQVRNYPALTGYMVYSQVTGPDADIGRDHSAERFLASPE